MDGQTRRYVEACVNIALRIILTLCLYALVLGASMVTHLAFRSLIEREIVGSEVSTIIEVVMSCVWLLMALSITFTAVRELWAIATAGMGRDADAGD